MKCLVTGGAGFIGSNLAKRLLEAGHEVTIYDNFTTGHENNIKDLGAAKLIRANISQFDRYPEVRRMDVIFHIGMPSTMMLYRNDSVGTMYEACQGMHRILEVCRETGAKLIFASSSSVYNDLDLPHHEEREILVKDFYTEARIFMERMAKLYSDLYGMHSIGFRFFAVYGPREEAKKGYANMVSQFLWSIMKGESPRIFGDGSQTRDFTYVDDVTRILMEAATKQFDQTEIFNIGTAHNYTFNDIVRVINEELGTNVPPVYVENPIKNYVHSLLADTTKLHRNFRPAEVELREGIRRLIAYYRTESKPPEMKNMEDYYVSKVKTKSP